MIVVSSPSLFSPSGTLPHISFQTAGVDYISYRPPLPDLWYYMADLELPNSLRAFGSTTLPPFTQSCSRQAPINVLDPIALPLFYFSTLLMSLFGAFLSLSLCVWSLGGDYARNVLF